jgi:hypothetical protein
MKHAIKLIQDLAAKEMEISKHLREAGDHIAATRHEKMARNLTKITKAAKLIFLP